MKRFISLVLVLAAVCCLAACSDKYANLSISVNDFGANLLKNCSFEFAPEAVDDASVGAAALKIDESKLHTVNGKPEMFYTADASSPERVFVIGAKDAATAKEISDGPVKAWIKEMRDGYSSYGPDQVPKLDSCVNMTAGRYVFVIVSNDNAAAKTLIGTMLDTALKVNG